MTPPGRPFPHISAPPVAAPPLADGQLTQVPLDNQPKSSLESQERAAKDQQLHATETSLRTKEEELRRMQEAVEKRVAQQVTRVEQEAKKLEQLRKELETIEDPTKKEVADLRKRIELVDRELRPMRALVERKEKELKDATTAYNNKNAQKSELVGKLFEIVTESERQRLAKLEEITSLLTQMERKEGGQGQEPKEEVQMYTWKDATLRELTDLLKEVVPEARRRDARLSFAFVYPNRQGRNVMKQAGITNSMPRRPTPDDNRTLHELGFQTGDFLDVAIFT
ncbi:unnamed protein product [Closterium sp. Yama58-4]|nr:unnamed protein product [Closterium sp. Yama58-4]